jgi:hypothetical protein
MKLVQIDWVDSKVAPNEWEHIDDLDRTRMSKKAKKTKKVEKRGPKPDILKLQGDWQSAVRKALTKKRSEEGWPDKK